MTTTLSRIVGSHGADESQRKAAGAHRVVRPHARALSPVDSRGFGVAPPAVTLGVRIVEVERVRAA